MKVIAGTNKRKREAPTKGMTEETSEDPKKVGALKIPEGAKDLSHTVKRIHNGYIKTSSYRHPETDNYEHHEVYYESDPFGHVEGLA